MHDPFGRSALPSEPIDRAGRVRALHAAAAALSAGEPLPRGISAWLGRALVAWLETGGDLELRLGVRAPRGSHMTAQRLILRAEPGRASSRMSDMPD